MFQAMPRQLCPKCPPEMVGKNRDKVAGPYLVLSDKWAERVEFFCH